MKLYQKTLLITFFLIQCVFDGRSQSPSWLWAAAIGGQYTDRFESITRDNSGNLIITGSFSGQVDFDPGPNDFTLAAGIADVFIFKTDSNKNFIWAKSIGSSGHDAGTNVICDDSSNIYVTGVYRGLADFDPGPGVFTMNAPSGGIFILKLDSTGAFQWAKSIYNFSTDYFIVKRIRKDENGNLYLGGFYQDSLNFKSFILKLNNVGDSIWAKIFGSPSQDGSNAQLNDMDVNNAGEIVLTGHFSHNIDLDPGPNTLLIDAQVYYDAFICKLDSSGSFQWGFNYGTNEHIYGYAIAFDSTNNIILAGAFSNSFDADPGPATNLLSTTNSFANYLVKLNPTGDYIWSQAIASCVAIGIASDAQNNLYVSGEFADTTDFNADAGLSYILFPNGPRDVFIFKCDSNGVFNWATKAGGGGWEQTSRVALGLSNDIYITGHFIGPNANFGPILIQNASTSPSVSLDGFVARLHNLLTGTIELQSTSELSVFPNPATTVVNVVIDQPAQIIICDLLGKELISKQITSKGKVQVEFDISFLASGVYLIKVENSVSKFVKHD